MVVVTGGVVVDGATVDGVGVVFVVVSIISTACRLMNRVSRLTSVFSV